MPITSAASDTNNMKGHMMRVSRMVSAVLSGDQLPHVRSSKLRREHDAKQRDSAHENSGERRNFVRQSPCRFIAFDRDFFRKRRDECRRQSALSEQIAQQIRQSKRHQEGIEVSSRAEKTGKNRFANQAKHPARQNRQADDSRRACASSPIFHRSHRRTKNSVRGFGKAKTLLTNEAEAQRSLSGYFKNRFMPSRSMMA